MHRRTDALLCALLLAGCGGKVLVDHPGDGSETHFVCVVDLDCASLGGPFRCVAGHCETTLRSSFEQPVIRVDAAAEPAAPLPLPTELSFPGNIAVDGVNAYVTTGGGSPSTYLDDAVMKQPIVGGSATALAGALGPTGLALDATHLYFTNYPSFAAVNNDREKNTVVKVPLAGGEPVTLAFEQRAPAGIAVDAEYVYWTNAVDLGTVMKVPKGGGEPVTLASGQYYPGAIAVDATHAYYVAARYREGDGALMKVAKTGGTPVLLVADRNLGRSIALDATDVYFSVGSAFYDSPAGSAMRVPIDGGDPVTLASDQRGPSGLAVDAAAVYWVNDGTYSEISSAYYPEFSVSYPRYAYNEDGAVMMLPKGGGTPTTLASGQRHPMGTAVDAKNVYWTLAVREGAILTTPKNPDDAGGSP